MALGRGRLAVHEAPLSTNTDHLVRVDFHGDRIKVFVDQKEIMDVTDRHPLLEKGQLGLAVKQGETNFSAVEVRPVGPLGAGSPTAKFTYKKWHNEDWFFDGLEPIAQLAGDTFHCKVGAGTRMIGYFPIYWMQYLGPEWYANTKRKWEVLESGPRLKWSIQGMTPKEEILSKFLATITYDPATRAYVSGFQRAVHGPEGQDLAQYLLLMNFCDFWVNNMVARPPCRPSSAPIVTAGSSGRASMTNSTRIIPSTTMGICRE